MPGYPAVLAALREGNVAHSWTSYSAARPGFCVAARRGLDLFALDAPHLYARPGNPYLGPDGRDWPDNAQRFAALSRAAADIGAGLLPDFAPDIVHAHDWQAGSRPPTFAIAKADGRRR